jgi:hypothetical protein
VIKSSCISERFAGASVALFLGILGNPATATVDGVTGPNFDLTAKEDYISTADGNTALAWGYAYGNGTMQYPGPTLIVNQGDVVTVTLHNALPPLGADAPLPVSIVFPEQGGVTAIGGREGLLTREALTTDDPATPENEAVVTYTFIASRPGTYLYHTGTPMVHQVEMGLVGAFIVRPNSDNQAYAHPGDACAQQYSFIYGYQPGDPPEPSECARDRGKPFPLALHHPRLGVTIGEFRSTSPYLGRFGILPPGAGGMNLNAGSFDMWHSHTEREFTDNGIFPGKMMTMAIIEPPGVPTP